MQAAHAVLLFHSACFFTAADWSVKNATVDPALALQRQTPRQFATSKVPRLLVPLVFGILVLSPPQVYLVLDSLAKGKHCGCRF